MKTKIIPVAAANEKDVITLQKIATKSFTAMFGPYHEPQAVKAYTDEAYALPILRTELSNPDSRTYFLKLNGKPISSLTTRCSFSESTCFLNTGISTWAVSLWKKHWMRRVKLASQRSG